MKKYQIKFQYNVEVPDQTKYVLFYVKKKGETGFYPISKILFQNNRYMKAEVLNKGVRTFINERIINLSPVEN